MEFSWESQEAVVETELRELVLHLQHRIEQLEARVAELEGQAPPAVIESAPKTQDLVPPPPPRSEASDIEYIDAIRAVADGRRSRGFPTEFEAALEESLATVSKVGLVLQELLGGLTDDLTETLQQNLVELQALRQDVRRMIRNEVQGERPHLLEPVAGEEVDDEIDPEELHGRVRTLLQRDVPSVIDVLDAAEVSNAWEERIHQLLDMAGIESFQPANGDEFNPREHSPVAVMPTGEEHMKDRVAACRRRGYRVGDRLLRKASVTLYR